MIGKNSEQSSYFLNNHLEKRGLDNPFWGSCASDGPFSVETDLTEAIPLLAYLVHFDAIQPTTEGGVTSLPLDHATTQGAVQEALIADASNKELRAIHSITKSETNDSIELSYVYAGGSDQYPSQLKNFEKAMEYVHEAIAEARLFFPFTDRINFRLLILPIDQQETHTEHRHSYSPLFSNLFSLVKRRGAAYSDETECYIVCLPKNREKSYQERAFGYKETANVETTFDRSLYIQVRHEITHGIQIDKELDSPFATEGVAMLIEGLHLNSNIVHGQVKKEDIDLDFINNLASKRSVAAYQASEYMLYWASHSLFRFIYDFFDQNVSQLGEMLDLMREPYSLTLAAAFEEVYGFQFKSILPMWIHELERGEVAMRYTDDE